MEGFSFPLLRQMKALTMTNPFNAPGAKLRFFPEALRRFSSQEWVQPIAVEIQPSERCDHSCPHCQSVAILGASERYRRARTGAHLDLALLDSLWEMPPQGIILSGNTGDPLAHPEFDVLLEQLGRRDCPLVLITNGHRLDQIHLERIVRLCTGIRVSLDASNAVEYAMTHGRKADWDRTLYNLRALLAARRRVGISTSECSIGVGFLTGVLPPEAMLQATQLSAAIGVDYIQFRPLHRVKHNLGDILELCREKAGKRLQIFASNAKYDRNFDECRRYRRCDAGNFYSLVDARGDVYFCCHHVGVSNAQIGSLRRKSWAQIVKSPIRSVAFTKFPRPSCVPLCRLHDHNEFIVDYLSAGSPHISVETIQDEFSSHAVFL